ncbi:hypothetical protein SASPL_145072 [Salvia splendens]|uniref:O-fucosyltransferase family protein n=1 Tax=Salvia splendens TaxID=180675 RepID=A0A8X8WID3_SALSN|nr:hypothetical protein SASPL_145072 [Salvia splendens]
MIQNHDILVYLGVLWNAKLLRSNKLNYGGLCPTKDGNPVSDKTVPPVTLPEKSQGYIQVFLDGGLNQQRMGVSCTYHMCPIREWFFDFEELNGGLVYMGNDSPCLVVMMRDEILKATSGALMMLKGVRKNNLYYYQGSTVVGTVATATSSNKKDAEATKLWHLRLGHAGERSLQILAKQGLLKEVWSGKPATDYDSLRIFGSIAYFHVTESKLDLRAKKALFMGFSAGVNPNSSDTSQQVEYTPKQVEFEEAVVIPTTNTTNDSPTEEEESDDEEVPPQEPSQPSEPIAVRRTRRENKKPARFADMVAYALLVVDDVPCIFSKAIESSESDGWKGGTCGSSAFLEPVDIILSGVTNTYNPFIKICDAVALAKILNATPIIPHLEVNPVWKDSSTFDEIFDVDHFINVLKDDVSIVKELPDEYLWSTREYYAAAIRANRVKTAPVHASANWYLENVSPVLQRLDSCIFFSFSGFKIMITHKMLLP